MKTVVSLFSGLASSALLAAAVVAAPGQLDLNFDGVPSGTPAGVLLPAGLRLSNALYDYAYDPNGDAIPGTLRWRADPSAPDVLADDPSLFGRGSAPSPVNAVEALLQPVLLDLGSPSELHEFRVTLDLDSLGANGLEPGNEDVALQFLDQDGTPVFILPVDQTTPGFLAEVDALSGIRQVLFPAGAFYDDLFLRFDSQDSGGVIPESATWLAGGVMLVAMGFTLRRHPCRQEQMAR